MNPCGWYAENWHPWRGTQLWFIVVCWKFGIGQDWKISVNGTKSEVTGERYCWFRGKPHHRCLQPVILPVQFTYAPFLGWRDPV